MNVVVAGLALAALALPLRAAQGEASAGSPPPFGAPAQVLCITVEQWSAADLGPAAPSPAEHPTLAALAARGVRCTDASAASSDGPSALFSLLSGVHPSTHGVRSAALPAAEARFPCAWRDDGPGGGAVAVIDPRTGAEPFARWFGWQPLAVPDSPFATAAAALESAAPTILWLHLGPQGEGRAATDALERGLAQLGSALERRGVAEQTLWVLVGSTGRAQRPRAVDDPLGLVSRERSAVPLWWVWPDSADPALPRGATLERPVGAVDVAATVAEGLGRPPAGPRQGRSLVRDLRGQWAWSGPVWVESPPERGGWTALRFGSQQLVGSKRFPGAAQLFDLDSDPQEAVNLAAERTELAVHLAEWMQRIDAECAALRAQANR
jgi:hypothetical protein